MFTIFQKDDEYFNKGLLMNLGFHEAMRTNATDCVVFHDVDIVPIDDRNSYMCGEKPRHLSRNIDNVR